MLISRTIICLLLYVACFWTPSIAVAQSENLVSKIENASWEIHEIKDDVHWKRCQFMDLFGSKQSITVLQIDLNNANIKVDIPHLSSGFAKTSTFAVEEGAFAAINGSYFDTKVGGSKVTFYKEGALVTPTTKDFPVYRDNAGFSIDQEGAVTLVKKPDAGWQAFVNPYTLLTSGPLLLYQGKVISQENDKFNLKRHPRTAVGITSENQLIAITVDGRSAMAHGMTTKELAEIMGALGCRNAMNFDGGGSTTMWIKDEPENGVVNFPSDNKIYDHDGERKVANSLVFILK